MSRIEPFRAFRPAPGFVEKVASPPYDVLTSGEARALAQENPVSFLRVVKPEIDMPVGTDPYGPDVYAKGAANLRRLIDQGVLIREERPAFYLYRQRMGDHVQTGVVAGASVDEYENGRIKKHENTRRVKEDDRTRHIEATNANTGPVFLTYRANKAIDGLVEALTSATPAYDFVAPDGIRHTLWVVDDPEQVDALADAFGSIPAMYIADGHHRSAAAARVREARHKANPGHTGDEPYNFFLAVIFPHDQLRIMDYNRVVKDLNGLDEDAFLERIRSSFEVEPTDQERPAHPREFGMFLAGRWYRLRARPGSFPADDPVRRLDVAILQDNLLSPVLGIGDPRTDERIDFVGGIRGTRELERRVASGRWKVAFAMYPTSIEELFAVADAGKVMPPKSTWFEPKLRSGLVVRPLDE
ncbi:MAG: DUF1015 domain-containing protein [Acidobacteria bacterium]|nr:DUF1015 domain-containing protein [Acidobacteriota bacterium]